MSEIKLFFRNKIIEIGNVVYDILSFRWLVDAFVIFGGCFGVLAVTYIIGFIYKFVPIVQFIVGPDIRNDMISGTTAEMIMAQSIVGLSVILICVIILAIPTVVIRWISSNIKLAKNGIEVNSKWK